VECEAESARAAGAADTGPLQPSEGGVDVVDLDPHDRRRRLGQAERLAEAPGEREVMGRDALRSEPRE
jgi:hypothetical protein